MIQTSGIIDTLLYDTIFPLAVGQVFTTHANHYQVLCDDIWQFPNYDIVVLYQNITLPFSTDINKYFLIKAKQQLILKALQRQAKIKQSLSKKLPLYTKDNENFQLLIERNVPKRFIILTQINLNHTQRHIEVAHHFGSEFLHEFYRQQPDFPVDTLQIFSVKDFTLIAQTLKSSYDLEGFLQFHQRYLLTKKSFLSEYRLLGRFIDSSDFFKTAYDVETQLFKHKLCSQLDKNLSQAIKPQHDNLALLNAMAEHLPAWQQFLAIIYSAYQKNPNNQQCIKIFQQLSQESLYSRFNLTRQLAMFINSAHRERGALVYQHSYSQFGHFYILIFYAQNSQAILHRSKISHNLKSIAKRAERQLQHSPIKTMTIIGFELNSEQQDMSVDMYWQEYSQVNA